MGEVVLDHFNKLKPSTMPMVKFYSCLSNESYQDASNTATHLCILPQFILKNGTIAPFLTIVWDQTDSCENQYRYASTIYLISCIDLEFSIIIDRKL